MFRLKNSVLRAAPRGGGARADGFREAEPDVRRVGARIACQCGCKDTLATCSMLECHFGKPGKEKIAQMQTAGMNDDQIVQSFIREYGEKVYLAPPSAGAGSCRMPPSASVWW